jgi:mono/diheme cytochrome c family protein
MRVYVSETLAVAAVGVVSLLAGERPPESYVKLMKDTNTAAQTLRGHVQAKDYDGIAADAAALGKLFADTEGFWTARKADDAIGFSKTGAKASADLEAAARAKNDDGVATAARAVNGTCMGCHTAHRERLPDGSSEIKH